MLAAMLVLCVLMAKSSLADEAPGQKKPEISIGCRFLGDHVDSVLCSATGDLVIDKRADKICVALLIRLYIHLATFGSQYADYVRPLRQVLNTVLSGRYWDTYWNATPENQGFFGVGVVVGPNDQVLSQHALGEIVTGELDEAFNAAAFVEGAAVDHSVFTLGFLPGRNMMVVSTMRKVGKQCVDDETLMRTHRNQFYRKHIIPWLYANYDDACLPVDWPVPPEAP